MAVAKLLFDLIMTILNNANCNVDLF